MLHLSAGHGSQWTDELSVRSLHVAAQASTHTHGCATTLVLSNYLLKWSMLGCIGSTLPQWQNTAWGSWSHTRSIASMLVQHTSHQSWSQLSMVPLPTYHIICPVIGAAGTLASHVWPIGYLRSACEQRWLQATVAGQPSSGCTKQQLPAASACRCVSRKTTVVRGR